MEKRIGNRPSALERAKDWKAFPMLSLAISSMIRLAIPFALFLAFPVFYRAQGARCNRLRRASDLTLLLLLPKVFDELQLRELL
jgi:hypothetical protein